MIKLNLGCGSEWKEQYPDYDGLDVVDNGQKYVGNVLTLLDQFLDDSHDEIMANHFLEHFNQNELKYIFTQVHRLLKIDGVFRIVVPSKESIRAYVLTHETFWTEETFRALEYDKQSSWPLFKSWKVVELVTNERPDIHCLLQKII